jgi:hypothetical protein
MSVLEKAIIESGVAVWHYAKQEFVPFIPCPGERRIRLDVFDGLDNYGVFPVVYRDNGTFDIQSREELTGWEICLS